MSAKIENSKQVKESRQYPLPETGVLATESTATEEFRRLATEAFRRYLGTEIML